MSTWFNYAATLKILVFSLLIGAALPALFAVGVRLGAVGAGVTGGGTDQIDQMDQMDQVGAARNPMLVALSWLIFALVLAAVIVGVLYIARDFIAQHTAWYILGADST